ncbi:uncharacterized protein LOC126965614 [Leptidea sinapis]|uniref:uncharacterized protein LOC126965614 n=1 Tax=Leptidea sinapis TaxID=189913 RepID=UPI002129076D|nr:uncharacterized protein LOC126965614 [Leptidea sinapis]
MFYNYLKFYNFICTLFGQRRPTDLVPLQKKSSGVKFCYRMWSIVIAIIIIANGVDIDVKKLYNLKTNDNTATINEIIVSLIVILSNTKTKDVLYINLYNVFNKIITGFKIETDKIKKFVIKLHIGVVALSLTFIGFIILEIILDMNPPFRLLIRIPLFLSMIHLIIHLSLMLALLKIINQYMFKLFTKPKPGGLDFLFSDVMKSNRRSISNYCAISFHDSKDTEYFDLKYLCKVYDDLCTSMQILQKIHGTEILVTVWLMFSSAVCAVALISGDTRNHVLVESIRGLLTFFWYTVGCVLDDQIRQEVDRINLLIIKQQIDFSCDARTKEILGVFKLAITSNSLQFTSYNLYRLNYTTMFSTAVSVITYSIIVIQLF